MEAEPPKRKRRWFQFSLRAFLIFVVLCALANAWVARWSWRKHQEQAAVDALQNGGGCIVRFDYQEGKPLSPPLTPPGPTWLRGIIGDNAFSEVVDVTLIGDIKDDGWREWGADIRDEALEHLRALPTIKELSLLATAHVTDAGAANIQPLINLEKLELSGTHVTLAGLDSLRGLTHLENVKLWDNKITDAGMARIGDLKGLRVLWLDESAVTDAGLASLEQLGELEELHLYGKFTDAGLVHLKGLRRLKLLCLQSSKITDAGLANLQNLRQLKSLNLAGTKITDAGLANLTNLAHLETLQLDKTNLTDGAIPHLKALTKLSSLGTVGTKITEAGRAELQKALPSCLLDQVQIMLPD